jgi:hypothetical protein
VLAYVYNSLKSVYLSTMMTRSRDLLEAVGVELLELLSFGGLQQLLTLLMIVQLYKVDSAVIVGAAEPQVFLV